MNENNAATLGRYFNGVDFWLRCNSTLSFAIKRIVLMSPKDTAHRLFSRISNDIVVGKTTCAITDLQTSQQISIKLSLQLFWHLIYYFEAKCYIVATQDVNWSQFVEAGYKLEVVF